MPTDILHVEAAAVSLANRLIINCDVDVPRISSLSELTLSFYIDLFEIIFKTPVTDLIVPVCSIEEEEHNMQSMIDTLSMDVLNISLCHISGEAIIARNPQAVYNLLEIFLGYCLLVTSSSEQKDLSDFKSCQVCKYNAEVLETPFDASVEMQNNWLPDEPDEVLFQEFTQAKPQFVELEEERGTYRTEHREMDQERGSTATIANTDTCEDSGSNALFETELPDSSKHSVPTYPVFTCGLFDARQTASTRDQVVKLTENQIRFLTSRLHALFVKKTPTYRLYEKAVERQQELLKIAKEDDIENARLKLYKEGQEAKMKIRSAFDAHSMRRVRLKADFGKYYLQHRSRMMAKDRTKEEVELVRLLKERLALQKERMYTLNRDIRDFEAEQYIRHQNRITSLENFYENRLSMLKEQLRRKQISNEIRRKSQAQEMHKLRLENRLKIENEIKFMQENILRDPFTST